MKTDEERYAKYLADLRTWTKDHAVTRLGPWHWQFKAPDTGMFANDIMVGKAGTYLVSVGDCDTIAICPYRQVLPWLAEQLLGDDSKAMPLKYFDYFSGKVDRQFKVEEFDQERAEEVLKEILEDRRKHDGDVEEFEEFEAELEDCTPDSAEAYYDFCAQHDIDDPCPPTRYTSSYLQRIAYLALFMEKLVASGGWDEKSPVP